MTSFYCILVSFTKSTGGGIEFLSERTLWMCVRPAQRYIVSEMTAVTKLLQYASVWSILLSINVLRKCQNTEKIKKGKASERMPHGVDLREWQGFFEPLLHTCNCIHSKGTCFECHLRKTFAIDWYRGAIFSHYLLPCHIPCKAVGCCPLPLPNQVMIQWRALWKGFQRLLLRSLAQSMPSVISEERCRDHVISQYVIIK